MVSLVNRPGVNANATINGVHTTTPAAEWRITPTPLKNSVRLARGRYREGVVHLGRRRELKPRELEVTIEWSSLKNRRQIEELLLSPAPHQICLWRYEGLGYLGDGFLTEFELPWPIATDSAAWSGTAPDMPNGRDPSSFAPVVKVGLSGTELDVSVQSAAAYDGGSPPAGEAWFRAGSRLFKLSSAPAEGATVYVWIVPVLSVLEAVDGPEKRLAAATFEPHTLRFLEARL